MSDTTQKIQIVDGPYGRAMVAVETIPAGEPVVPLGGTVVNEPDRYTLQMDNSRHLAPEGRDWAFVNHSCAPCVKIDFGNNAMVALRDIQAGEEVTFNYLTTEYRMAEPFKCACGAADCRGTIAGFSALTRQQQAELRHHLSDYLAGLVDGDA